MSENDAFVPFEEPIQPITTPPLSDNMVGIAFDKAWVKAVVGALMTLIDAATWAGSEADIKTAQHYARHIIVTGGNVLMDALGIGVSPPTGLLHVKGTADPVNIEYSDPGTNQSAAQGLNIINIDQTVNNQQLIAFRDGVLSPASAKIGGRSHHHDNNWGDVVVYTRHSDGFLPRAYIGLNTWFLNSNVGFYGVTPVARQQVTGSRATGEALLNLLAKLNLTGIIQDLTTA